MEPLRALLSTRSSRAYVAIDRATRDFQSFPVMNDYAFQGHKLSVYASTLKKVRLDNRFYELPLGWALSAKTREIIEGQSGRYWECQPDDHFEQAQIGLAPSDCVQLLIYHELSKTVGNENSPQQRAVGRQIAISNYLMKEEQFARKKDATDNESPIVACYRDRTRRTINLEQAGNMRALIKVWRDRYRNRDDLFGYVMGTAAYESSDFRTRRQSLLYTSSDQILRTWKDRFADIAAETQAAEIERLYVGQPQALAEKVYGGLNGNGKSNGDGWKYRGRGLAFVTYKEEYQKFGKALRMPELVDDPDLIFIPKVNASIFIVDYFQDSSVAELGNLVASGDLVAARLKVRQAAMRRPLSADEIAEQQKYAADVWSAAQTFVSCIKESRAQAN